LNNFAAIPITIDDRTHVEFMRARDAVGDSLITVTDPSTTSAVPEPTTLALLTIGLLAFGVRRKTARVWRIAA